MGRGVKYFYDDKSRQCYNCLEIKPLADFYWQPNKIGATAKCRECLRIQNGDRYRRLHPPIEPTIKKTAPHQETPVYRGMNQRELNSLKKLKQVERYKHLKDSGICVDCSAEGAVFGKLRCKKCITKRRERRLQRQGLFTTTGRCKLCGYDSVTEKGYCVSCYDYQTLKDRIRTRSLKMKVLAKYGQVCVCCGESQEMFLTVDHINNDGGVERQKKAKSQQLYREIIKEERNDLQILCFNCNCGRYINGGICPHKALVVYQPTEKPSIEEGLLPVSEV